MVAGVAGVVEHLISRCFGFLTLGVTSLLHYYYYFTLAGPMCTPISMHSTVCLYIINIFYLLFKCCC